MKLRHLAALLLALILPFSLASAKPIQKALTANIYAFPVGPMFWTSGAPQADGLNWIFPPWFPQKVYIVGATIGQQQPPDGKPGQISVGIDRKGLSYRNATSPFHQGGGDDQWDRIASMWIGGKQEQDFPISGPPKLLDRSAGDRLWIQNDTQAFTGPPAQPRSIWIVLNYQVDDTDVPPVLTGWNSLFPMIMEGNAVGWGINTTIAQVVDASWISGFVTGSASKTRVTFSADHISSAYIGARVPGTLHQAVSLQQLTFGGLPGAIANGSGLIVSDDMPWGIDTTNGVVITFHLVDGSVRYRTVQPSAKNYYKAGDDASNPNGAGYSTSVWSVNSVINIEQFY